MFDRKLVFAASCLVMLVVGVVITTLGSILPSLIDRFGVDKAEAGSLFLLLSFGFLIGSVVFGPLADRYGYRGLLLVCLALVLLGLEGIAFAPSFGWLRVAVLCIGAAGGVVNGGANALVSDISEGGRGATLSLLGIFFGLGAVGVPFVLALLLGRFPYDVLVAATGLTVLLPLALTAMIRFPSPKHAQGFPLRDGLRLTSDRTLLLMGLMLFLQSGMEITVGGWTAAYFQEQIGMTGSRSLFFLSLFWFGMMLSRLVLGTLLRDASPVGVLRGCIATALLGSLTMIAAHDVVPAAAGAFLVGAGLAAGFPLILAMVGDRYAALSGTAFGIVLAMALSGGMTMPYLTGVLGQRFGLRASLLLVPLALCLFAALYSVVLRRTGTSAEPAPSLPTSPET